jgi:hypothetical protein
MNELTLAKEIYPLSCIEDSCTAYKKLCSIQIYDKDGHYLLRFSNCRFDENKTLREFENYLIQLVNIYGTSY